MNANYQNLLLNYYTNNVSWWEPTQVWWGAWFFLRVESDFTTKSWVWTLITVINVGVVDIHLGEHSINLWNHVYSRPAANKHTWNDMQAINVTLEIQFHWNNMKMNIHKTSQLDLDVIKVNISRGGCECWPAWKRGGTVEALWTRLIKNINNQKYAEKQ